MMGDNGTMAADGSSMDGSSSMPSAVPLKSPRLTSSGATPHRLVHLNGSGEVDGQRAERERDGAGDRDRTVRRAVGGKDLSGFLAVVWVLPIREVQASSRTLTSPHRP